MKTKKIILILFVILGLLFIVGSILKVRELLVISNFFLMPFLLLYYRFKAKRLFWPIVATLLLFYVRDIFLVYGFSEHPFIIQWSFLAGMLLLLTCVITGFEKSRVHPVEIISFLIMYGFLGFLFISISEIVPEVVPSHQLAVNLLLFLLVLVMALSFTNYLLKSHYASLWLMVASGSLLVSEISLFFKMFVIEDLSVNFFFPVFHVLAYYSLVEFGLRRRRKVG